MAGDKIKANDVGLPAIDGKFIINMHFEKEWWAYRRSYQDKCVTTWLQKSEIEVHEQRDDTVIGTLRTLTSVGR